MSKVLVLPGPAPSALPLDQPVMIPRDVAIDFATLERDALWARASGGGPRSNRWRRAAQHTAEVVRYLRRGEDLAAIQHAQQAVWQTQQPAFRGRSFGVMGDSKEASPLLLIAAVVGGVTLYWWLVEGKQKHARRRRQRASWG
jgi:hypothetical protein